MEPHDVAPAVEDKRAPLPRSGRRREEDVVVGRFGRTQDRQARWTKVRPRAEAADVVRRPRPRSARLLGAEDARGVEDGQTESAARRTRQEARACRGLVADEVEREVRSRGRDGAIKS
jgi:hypothetical protein